MKTERLPEQKRADKWPFEQANGGTIFLDEMEIISLKLKATTRVLQEKRLCVLAEAKLSR